MTKRPSFGHVTLVLAVTLLMAPSAQAQQPPRDRTPPPTAGTAAIRGHVVDGLTGMALARARVQLQGNRGPRASALTDGRGAFAFTKLPARRYLVVAEKSTYLPARYPDPGRSIRAATRDRLSLRGGQTAENVTVAMFRAGVIAGRVVDAYGDPVESAEVRIASAQKGASRLGWRPAVPTNDLGEFRVSRLEPGRYLVAVLPHSTFVDEPPVPGVQPLPELLPTFYPGAVSLDQAQPITLSKGQAVLGIDILLAEGTPTLVSGVVLSREGPPVKGNGTVNARSASNDALPGDHGWATSIRPDGTFRLKLPPGEYALEAQANRPSPRHRADEEFGTARVSVGTEELEGITIVIGGGAEASGRVVFEGRTPPPVNPGQVRLPIYSQDGVTCRAGEATIATNWAFRVEGLFGTCSPPSQSAFGRWSLKAVMYRGQNLLDRPITFDAGQRLSDVQVIFTDRETELAINVADKDGQATRDYVAILYSADKERWGQIGRYVRTYVPPSDEQLMRMMNRRVATSSSPQPAPALPPDVSRQVLMGLPAGNYYAVAVDDIEIDALRDPAALERLISSATRVTVTHDAAASVALQRITLSDVVR